MVLREEFRNNLKRDLNLVRIIFWREFNGMYRRSALGPLWSIISPVAYLCVFVFFRLFFGLPSVEDIPLIPFLFSGLTVWMLFSQIVTTTFPSIVANTGILKKVPVSPLVFVFSATLLPLLTTCVYLLLLEVMLLYYGVYPSLSYLAIPLIIFLTLSFSTGLGLLVCVIAFYRQDIIQILPTFIQLGMFATPIFFPPSIVPENMRWVIEANPLAGCIDMFRDCVFSGVWPTAALLGKTFIAVALLWGISLPLFRRTGRYIADIF